MLKAASLTVRVKPETLNRLDKLASITRRSKSFVIEDALEQYLDLNEWQIKGIQDALIEADSPCAVFEYHDAVLAKWEAKVARKHRVKADTVQILRVYHTSRKWPVRL